MNRFVTLFLVGMFSACTATASTELVFLTWSEHIDPAVVKQFEKRFQCKVQMRYFDNKDQRDSMLLDTQATGYDVILASDLVLKGYNKIGWLAPLTQAQVPNMRYIDRKWIDDTDSANGFAIPYLWGTVGIAYRPDLLQYDITSWQQLFRPAPILHQKIIMLDDSNALIGIALKTLGHSINTTDNNQLIEAQQLLFNQKLDVKAYDTVNLDENSALVTGDIYVAMIYNGGAIALQDINPNIKFVLPEEGSVIWIDFLTVSANSRQKKLAYEFINFLNEPHNAAKNALYTHYPTPNQAAEKLLPDAFIKNAAVYPNAKVISKSEIQKNVPPRIQKIRNTIFSNLNN